VVGRRLLGNQLVADQEIVGAVKKKAAPTNTPPEFLAMRGVIGLGRMVAEGRTKYLSALRTSASDPRLRIREGVAMPPQRVGDRDMRLLLREVKLWSEGGLLKKRAAAVALC
jgi:nucleoid-associated protein YgaU